MNPKLKKKWGGGRDGAVGRGARVSEFFLQRIQISKKTFYCGGGGWGSGEDSGGDIDGWTDEQAQIGFFFEVGGITMH